MDFSILYALQNLRSVPMDHFMVFITNLMGSYGQMWIVLGLAFLLFKKTRKCGAVILTSYILVLVLCQYGLKDLIARARPCHIDQTVQMLVARPASFSCPSTHTCWAFAAATSVYMYFKKAGVFAVSLATVIAFSRLYLFVHFPTDVLLGMFLGISMALVCRMIADKLDRVFGGTLTMKACQEAA